MTVHDRSDTFVLPRLSCPFPVAISPHLTTVQTGTQQWIATYEVLSASQMRHFTRALYGELAARVYPYARLPLLQLCSDWLAWLFAVDDVIYETDELRTVTSIPECLQVLSGESSGRSGFGRALADVRTRIAFVATPSQVHRWVAATREYLLAQTWELATRTSDHVPSLEAYLTMRRLTGAMATVYALIDVAAEAPLDAELWSEPMVRSVRHHAINVVAWDNDLISWRKEKNAANGVNNLVAVMAATGGLSMPDVVDRIIAMREKAVTGVVELGQLLISRQEAPLTAFVHGLQAWISGSLAYSMHSPRYMSDTAPAGDVA
ncbi:hypothetical protein [Nonomuraea sp. NPDC050202]|uniref:terpene synthase family protein n=1 Tax=Nonomuraea sp. NPDC050202 TaxID=3155035 RepID=UPI0033F174AD